MPPEKRLQVERGRNHWMLLLLKPHWKRTKPVTKNSKDAIKGLKFEEGSRIDPVLDVHPFPIWRSK